ncbi:helicase-exonuclease AddAB subunit AddB [Bacillus sp. DNRA2]|uniref:helicase-exonuclease AddAB subunit AddB n=1 Tax=Bacillus sp. DNRA2 TaxID=2723053 RepID=UPI00145F3663|nr:helicase-exonuclease AddAB subunit AddB [Bacillus sp. DNRA2]NMD70851.1 helicase-exonuclease AddAB subunit AddB [Bacillus sp. DNRA2]
MSVRFLIGRSGSGKTETCLREISERLQANPGGDPIIYLVPEQMTFLSEQRLATNPELLGMIRAQVYSFTRLAWRVLQETGGFNRYHLTSTGISMLIRKIIEDQKGELTLFHRAADKNGFIEQMEQMLTEFKRYCIKPEELAEKQGEIASQHSLADKLHDLEKIYQHFEEALLDKYLDSEDYFLLLAEKAGTSTFLKEAEVYIDGFYSFTPIEYLVLQQLMKHCKRVTITLTLDEIYTDIQPDELQLFRMSGDTCQTLHDMIRAEGIVFEEPILLNEPLRWEDASFLHLEKYFDMLPVQAYQDTPAIHIVQAANRRAEIEGIARKINQLVANHNYRYREIAILARNTHEYRDVLEATFTDYEIPVYLDQKTSMQHHPLIELLRSSLEILNGYWRYEPIFRAVKTELLFPFKSDHEKLREQMDRLENYVLAYGIQGDKWTRKQPWTYRKFRGLELENVPQTDAEQKTEAELNELRTLITTPLLQLSRRLKKSKNGREQAEALYLFLEELEIPRKLERWKQVEEERGNLLKAREHDQVWNGIIELLDQFVEMLGEEKIPQKQFAGIIDSGIESLRFSLVPPALDQVIVADLEKSRLEEIKIVFVIGLNEGVLPAKLNDEGILADEDREVLLGRGIKIAPSSRIRLLDENFLAYKAFTLPKQQLFLSYPLANEEGKALMPSPYIKRMQELFPKVAMYTFVVDPSELSEKEQLEYVGNENTTLAYLTAQLQLKKEHYPIYDFWWDVYNHYIKNEPWRRGAIKVLSSLFYDNKTARLSEQESLELYGDHIQASVSRMEMFHSCPFSHFAHHGLKLRERQVFRLEAPDIGELFHAALKHIADTVNEKNLSWEKMTESECALLAGEAVEILAPKLQHEILLSSNRHAYLKRKLEKIIKRAAVVLSEHAKASGFAPIGLELGFGPKGDLPPIGFNLKNGTKMELVGRIDRVDKATSGDDVYLRVIDYKSSERDLNLSEMYYGLSLQMLTYLDILITHSKQLIGRQATPAGVLYFHVHDPVINAKKMLTLEEIEQSILKQFKMNGLILGEQNVIQLMDKTLETGDSQVIPAGINKDGSIRSRSKVVSKQEFEQFTHYVRNTYVNSGDQMLSGAVEIAPYKLKNKQACTFCSFKSICQFDPSLTNNEYRHLPILSKDEILNKIQKEDVSIGSLDNTSKTE